jgi:hypothetical protein
VKDSQHGRIWSRGENRSDLFRHNKFCLSLYWKNKAWTEGREDMMQEFEAWKGEKTRSKKMQEKKWRPPFWRKFVAIKLNFFVLLLLNFASACKRGKRRQETHWLWLRGYKPTKLLKFAEGTSIYVLSIFALENLGWLSNENPILSYFPTLSFNQLSFKVSTK